ncbi:MAG: alpha-amylase family glycosyl hydrolase [Saprospiraceae bacterium]
MNNIDLRSNETDSLNLIKQLYDSLYADHSNSSDCFNALQTAVKQNSDQRSVWLRLKDHLKAKEQGWFLSNELIGMSLYVDRFAGNIEGLVSKLDYLQEAGINVLHLMPLFQSPPGENDGGYAVSDFRKVDPKFGSMEDLKELIHEMNTRGMHLMLDIVLNHTSHHHAWAESAQEGKKKYQDYYYMYDDRTEPDQFESMMPEIFPENAPGNFTYNEACKKWVMTVFHQYQWDLNFSNPGVFVEMLDTILFYANLGVDILRIDAPAFIWKTKGTNCQNLPQAHTLLKLIKQCVLMAAPGMAILGEAIVAPSEIMKYFGDGFSANECDFAYNATLMALQWDALATGKTRVMRHAQRELLSKPEGTSWISYTRCHDDIGMGFSDDHIRYAGFEPFYHRKYLQDYFSGLYAGSPASGDLFSVNPRTNDARISGSLASLCGLEKAIKTHNENAIRVSIDKILFMQAHSFFIGGLPMLFYGDEVGYTNDYSYLDDPAKSYDNRWMHRPVIDWNKNSLRNNPGTVEYMIFNGIKKIASIRKKLPAFSDHKNITWLPDEDIHLSAFLRYDAHQKIFCLFNFSSSPLYISWYIVKVFLKVGDLVLDHWTGTEFKVGSDQEHFMIPAYGMIIGENK